MNTTFWLALASAAGAGVLGLAAIVRKRTPVRGAFAAGMLALAADATLTCVSSHAGNPLNLVAAEKWRLVAMSWIPGTWLVFALTYARGNASGFLARWRYLVIGSFLIPIGVALSFLPHLVRFEVDHSPEGIWMLRLGWSGLAVHLAVLLGAILILANIERTYRTSVGTMRWRIKFLLLGVVLVFGVRVYTNSQAVLFRIVDSSWHGIEAVSLLFACALMTRSLVRHGSFSTQVYPSFAALHGTVTLGLAGVYLLAVGALAKMAERIGGDASFPLKAFVVLASLLGLAILLQSDRAQMHVRRLVSRHFRRPVHDYRMAWLKFSKGSASHSSEKELCESFARLVAETFEALSVSIWLLQVETRALTLSASTAFTESALPGTARERADILEMARHFREHPEPIDIDTASHPWAATLRRCHPSQFQNKGSGRVCVPLIGRGELLGVLISGDRVGGAPFSSQDLDMLCCIGEHASAGLLNSRLSQKLAQTREFGAFQSMAAFLVHDLKNAGSTLKLLMRNLPDHWEDPQFRDDAVRGVSKAMSHIEELVNRLGLVRHRLQLKPAPSDLNEVVRDCLRGWRTPPAIQVITDLAPLPVMSFDGEQIAKVITNLLLNAVDAISGAGEIQVATRIDGEDVILTVSDNGCGMTADYLRDSLFQPFRTTKTGGMGIGMFQSKTIIEAHHGSISVNSEAGVGSTFRIHLPLAPRADPGGPDAAPAAEAPASRLPLHIS